MHLIKKFSLTILILLLLLAISAAIAYFNRQDAMVYLSAIWVGVCTTIIVKTSKPKLRLAALYVGIGILAFGISEAYFTGWLFKSQKKSLVFTVSDPTYFQPHSLLGVSPKKSSQIRAQKTYKDEPLYNVQYTITSNGVRNDANIASDSAPAVLFYGGSFTFGEGVEDGETLPNQFEKKTQGQLKAFNFGFHGYGPHQMLVSLENELEKPIIGKHPPRYLVYQAISDHINRCAGTKFWDQSGPKYILDENGEAIYQGPFQHWLIGRGISLLARSVMVRKWFAANSSPTLQDAELFTSIVSKAASIFKDRYGGEFYMIIWPGEMPLYRSSIAKLEASHINIIPVETILPDADTNIEKYRIHPNFERHPNALAYEKIAEYLAALLSQQMVKVENNLK